MQTERCTNVKVVPPCEVKKNFVCPYLLLYTSVPENKRNIPNTCCAMLSEERGRLRYSSKASSTRRVFLLSFEVG